MTSNAEMYGCGAEGIALSNVSCVKVENSVISRCTYYIMAVTGGENVAFEDCMFVDNRELTLVNVSKARNMKFSNRYFNDNPGQMFEVEGTTVTVSNSSFNRNKTNFPMQDRKNLNFINCKFN